ncbi:1-acyl-sn-glycerol-3-phosphate acyltransferase [Burkholderiales bacterium JOSHI_001]|nr:1-acyl-sn-glycerol-3-phosphate acyltransferase [Burkholderiales bacterium JOSHI_001]
MRTLLALWRLARLVLHLLHGLAVMGLRFGSLNAAGRQRRIQWWSAGVLRCLGLRLEAQGSPRPGATLLVANHVSWLDIAALHAVAPQARFVSKADVLHWPLLGWLVRGAGTLFIERERKRDALRVVHQMADALRRGDMVAVFPEGTTGTGPELLPFHANLLQAAIVTETPIQPAVLRFDDDSGHFCEAATFVGDTTLVQSMWRIACARGMVVNVRLLPPLQSAHADRRALAATLQHEIAHHLAPTA